MVPKYSNSTRLRFTFFLLFSAFASQTGLAQEALPVDSEGAVIIFDQTEIGWGEVLEGDTARAYFSFTNTGTVPVEIQTVKKSCSCTEPRWTQGEIPPGEKGMVEAGFGTRDKLGEQERTLTVIYNGDPPIRLKMYGKVLERPIESAPPPDNDRELKISPQDTNKTWGGFGGDW